MLRFEFLFELTAEVGELVTMGAAPLGERRVVEITGGRFEGPGLRGEVLSGNDWQIARRPGAARRSTRLLPHHHAIRNRRARPRLAQQDHRGGER
jgi:hypothetical protein